MKIFVSNKKGNYKKVRTKEIEKEIVIEFNDLNETGQQRIFLENKDSFLAQAITSKYKVIREKAEEYINNNCTCEVLNELIIELLEAQGYTDAYTDQIEKVLNSPKLELADYVCMKIADSSSYILKAWLANEYNKTSNDVLNRILHYELEDFRNNGESSRLFDDVIMHPNFKLTLKGKYYGYGMIEKIEARIKELRG